MIYRTLKRIIERGDADLDELELKVDVFYAASKLTKEEYDELIQMINDRRVPPSEPEAV